MWLPYLLIWLFGCGLEAGETVVFVGELAALVVTDGAVFVVGLLFTVMSLSAVFSVVSLVTFLHTHTQ